jgi:hypothetical protein
MQVEEGGDAATSTPKPTPQDGDKRVRSPAEAAAWAGAPPFVPAAKEKAAAIAAAPKADSRGNTRADDVANLPKKDQSFAEALRGKFAAPASTVGKAKSQAPGVKRDLSPTNSPVKSKEAKTPKTTSTTVPVLACNTTGDGTIVTRDGRRFVVEDVEEEDEEDNLYFCNHAHFFGRCKLTGCVAVSPVHPDLKSAGGK